MLMKKSALHPRSRKTPSGGRTSAKLKKGNDKEGIRLRFDNVALREDIHNLEDIRASESHYLIDGGDEGEREGSGLRRDCLYT